MRLNNFSQTELKRYEEIFTQNECSVARSDEGLNAKGIYQLTVPQRFYAWTLVSLDYDVITQQKLATDKKQSVSSWTFKWNTSEESECQAVTFIDEFQLVANFER